MYSRFEQLLTENNTTAYRVAKDTGIAQATLSDWKNGKSNPKYEKLAKIADYFNVSVEWLNGESEQRKPLINGDEELTELLEFYRNRPEGRILFSVAKGCTTEEIEQAVRIIDALRRKDDD